ncbi:hypothetical protein [Clostridium sp. DJ247]|uniref:hypothetical protein n=1 Tax=Clostridium sp. DJ247 TaxID=2726188 RepID=UPI0016265AC1|nr:hypothetical protein [Clostridium sp. DJ247]MBC2580849.1 hypothetical protein [Clostridium sp. DJ247]
MITNEQIFNLEGLINNDVVLKDLELESCVGFDKDKNRKLSIFIFDKDDVVFDYITDSLAKTTKIDNVLSLIICDEEKNIAKVEENIRLEEDKVKKLKNEIKEETKDYLNLYIVEELVRNIRKIQDNIWELKDRNRVNKMVIGILKRSLERLKEKVA